MPLIGDAPSCGLDEAPPDLVLNRAFDRAADELAAATRAGKLVNLRHQRVIDFYVHSHVLSLAHVAGGLYGRIPARAGARTRVRESTITPIEGSGILEYIPGLC